MHTKNFIAVTLACATVGVAACGSTTAKPADPPKPKPKPVAAQPTNPDAPGINHVSWHFCQWVNGKWVTNDYAETTPCTPPSGLAGLHDGVVPNCAYWKLYCSNPDAALGKSLPTNVKNLESYSSAGGQAFENAFMKSCQASGGTNKTCSCAVVYVEARVPWPSPESSYTPYIKQAITFCASEKS